MDLHIKIDDLKVTEVTVTSGIFSGENYHAHWSAMNKTNTGLNLGDSNVSSNCINMVYDSDLISMFKRPEDILSHTLKQVKQK